MAIASQYYICNRCSFRTTLLSRINDHLLEHNKQPSRFPYFDCFDRLKPLKCPSCDFSTESLILLRYHLVRKHDQRQFALKAKLKTCNKCRFCTHSNYLSIRHRIFGFCKGKKGSKEEKEVTVSMKKGRKWYFCEKCGYRTVVLSSLKNHVINKHTPLDEIDWQYCNKCPAKYKTLLGLKIHQRNVHGSAVGHLNCPECDYSTHSRSNLTRHFNNKHTQPEEIKWVECYHCGAKFKNKDQLKTHLVTHKEKQFKCDQCSFKSYHKGLLKRHITNSHIKDEDVKWYKCQHCDFKTKRKCSINNHIHNVHSESVELVQCPHCSVKFKNYNSLKRHISRFHDDSTFKCDLCNYRAKLEKTVEIHKKNKHEKKNEVNDVKLFKCEYCHYTSTYPNQLRRHILVNHNINGEVFKCKECPYNSNLKKYLNYHITMKHKPARFNCVNCSFATKTNRLLQNHIFSKHTVHTEEDKLNCPHCTYSSFCKENLDRHLKLKHEIRDNIRWYNCDKCNYKNQHKHLFVSHMYKVHKCGKLLECDQCTYKTGSPSAMYRHKNNHKKFTPKTDSERFECYNCGFTTNTKRCIKIHITRNHLRRKNKETDK